MRFARPLSLLLLCATVAACGDGPTGPGDGPEPNFVRLESDAGDWVGAGRTYEYTQANAVLSVSADGRQLDVAIEGDEWWFGSFELPSALTRFQTGTYAGLTRHPFNDPARGGLDWSGEGRGCNELAGSFTVEQVRYVGDSLAAIDLTFEQHCEGATPALRGTIHWRADDTTSAPGPVTPVPSGLWRPPAGATPTSGNYVYVQSDPGDWAGQGRTAVYTSTDWVIGAQATGRLLRVFGVPDGGEFMAMSSVPRVERGYYPDLQRYPFHNPMKGGMSWGQGGCNTLTGWVAVDSITYVGDSVTALDLRFEQHCEGAVAALRGSVHWRADDPTRPPGPVQPPPADLWRPPAGATPTSGNYVYLASDPGDYIGGGSTVVYTGTEWGLMVQGSGRQVSVTGAPQGGEFVAMSVIPRMELGYYPNVTRAPFHNPVKGGMNWSGSGRGCNTLTGWFVVDHITYANDVVTALDLRFEQHCEGAAPALRGQVRWRLADTASAPGPVTPPPAGLWDAPAGATPASGDYVYLQSESGDYIGQGGTFLYTEPQSPVGLTSSGGRELAVSVGGWNGNFATMNSIPRFQPGYYGDLARWPFHNVRKGGLSWSGNGRGCNTLTGWFVVDDVVYTGTALTAITLRFEQHCEGLGPALRGKIRWTA